MVQQWGYPVNVVVQILALTIWFWSSLMIQIVEINGGENLRAILLVTIDHNQKVQPKILCRIPSGYLTVRHGKSPFLIGKPSMSMGHRKTMANCECHNQRVIFQWWKSVDLTGQSKYLWTDLERKKKCPESYSQYVKNLSQSCSNFETPHI